MHYIKKYFGTARCFAEHGSLTIIGGVSFGSGDAVDDAIYAELSAVANAEVRLSEELAKQRIFPAVDVALSYSDCAEKLFNEEERSAELTFRKRMRSSADAEAA